MENVELYFQILLGGLFGVATIVVAIMSLVANIINSKFLNMYINKMIRFNILFTFSPIFYVVLYCFSIMKWHCLVTNKWAIIIGVGGFLLLTTICSYLTAQYLIDTERFQKSILNISKNKLKKELENNNDYMVVISYMMEANRNINSNDCRIFQDLKSREKLYSSYLELIDMENLDDENAIHILNLLIEEFGIYRAIEICNFRIGQLTYLLMQLISDNSSQDLMKLCIQAIHSYFYNQSIKILSNDQKFEKYREIVGRNKQLMIYSNKYLTQTVKYLYEKKFAITDAHYLESIILQLYDISKVIKIDNLGLDKDAEKFIKELISTQEEHRWFYDDTEKDQAIKSALNLIGGDIDE